MKKTAWCAALVCGLAAAMPAMAQPDDGAPPPPPPGDAGGAPPPPPGGPAGGPPPDLPNFHQLHQRADKDGDGAATLEDFKAVAPKFSTERFADMDRNSDGSITRDELPKPRGDRRGPRPGGPDGPGGPGGPDGPHDEWRGPGRPEGPHGHGGPGGPGGPRGDMLRRADTDGNKEVTLEEFKAFMQMEAENHFKRMDTNADGVITGEDRPPRGPGGPDGPRPGGPGGRDEMGPPPGGPDAARVRQEPADRLKQLLRDCDADGNGEVTFEEVKAKKPGMPEEAFKRLDGNGDGVLSAADPAPKERPAQDMRDRFRKADSDGDGKLSKEEAMKGFPNMTEEVFKQRDRNGDGYLGHEDRREQ